MAIQNKIGICSCHNKKGVIVNVRHNLCAIGNRARLDGQKDGGAKEFTSYAKFQLNNDKVDLIDKVKVGDNVTVSFNIRGNKSEKDNKRVYYTNLECWKIEKS